MKLYFAGADNVSQNKILNNVGAKNCLFSYYYLIKNKRDFSDKIRFIDKNIFLDSGAYSAWTKGVEIDIDAYIEFIKKNKKSLTVYACLDVIGDYNKTLANQRYMESKKLNPLWVFHSTKEPFELLKEMSQEYNYIALGGVAGVIKSKKKQIEYLDKCFSIIGNKKVHGFGITSQELLLRYPFYSVDSTTWLGGGMRAEIYKYQNGRLKAIKTTLKEKINFKTFHFTDNDDKRYIDRNVNNVIEWQKFEKYVTSIWESRGIKWQD